MKRRILIVVLLLIGAAAVVVAALWNPSTDGIDVTVVNRGPGTITAVEVQALPNAYPLGKLTPGGSGSGRLTTGTQSDIAVEFRDADGMPHRVESGVSFKRGDRGKVTIEIEGNTLARLEQQVGPK